MREEISIVTGPILIKVAFLQLVGPRSVSAHTGGVILCEKLFSGAQLEVVSYSVVLAHTQPLFKAPTAPVPRLLNHKRGIFIARS